MKKKIMQNNKITTNFEYLNMNQMKAKKKN